MRIFLEPKSLVLIGASRKTGQGAYNGVEMMLRYGYSGKIYPINPKADEICGLKAYPTVAAVPEVADLATISVGRDHVIPAFNQCIEAGIRRVIIISQGFSDADKRGRELQEQITLLARGSGVRVLGPNTLGVTNNFRGLSTGFIDLPRPVKIPPVALIAQTGLLQVAPKEFSGCTWGKAIDIGNACDVDFVDALEYFGTDPEIRVIAVYMEGFLRARKFLEAASRISLTKPIIVFKTGRTAAGARAALSHTGSLAGEDEINDAAFRRAGIIRVKNVSEFRDAVHSFLKFDDLSGPRLGVLTPSGAAGIMATDACDDFGLTIGNLPENLAGKLKEGLPDWVHIGNPVDIWPVGMLGDGFSPAYKQALCGLLNSPEIDAVLALSLSMDSPLHKDIDIAAVVAEAGKETNNTKPVSMWIYGTAAAATVEKLEAVAQVACFDSVEQAVRGLSFVYRYHQLKGRRIPAQRTFPYDRKAADLLLAKGRQRKVLLGEDALDLLSIFGIPAASGKIVRNWREIETAAEAFSYPVVLKLSGEAFLHKSEWEGVVTDIRNKKELRGAWKKMKENVRLRNPKLKIGFQLQEQAAGKELLLGLKLDPKFGHVLVCGLGGVYAEVFKDISRELVPVGRSEAEKMLSSLKIYPLLKGVRGEAGIDQEGMLEILERLSFLATCVPDITELDINPLMAAAGGCKAVDARIIW